MARYNVDLQDNEGNAYQIMANPDSVAEFSPAANRENIRSGETYRVIFGKIMKYLSEVGNAAYVGLANNCTTTIAGFALDARQGKELMDRINELNRDLGGLSFAQDSEGNWGYKIGGADPVIPFRRVAYTSQMVTLGDSESAKFTFGTVSGFKLLSYTLKTDFSDRQVYLYVNNVKIDECASGIKTGTYDLDIAQNYKIELRSRWGICSGFISLK